MQFIIEILIVSFLVFLFGVFVLSKDDFVLLRKNVSLEELFNIGIVAGIVGVIVSRLGFVLGSPHIMYLNPLVFLALPYFPGLSLSFGIVGGFLYIFLYTMKKKFPIKRIFDVMITAFAGSMSIGSLLSFVVFFAVDRKMQFVFLVEFFVYLVLLSFLSWLFTKSKTRDGDTSIVGMFFICFTQIVFLLFLRGINFYMHIGFDDVVFLAELVVVGILFVNTSRKLKK